MNVAFHCVGMRRSKPGDGLWFQRENEKIMEKLRGKNRGKREILTTDASQENIQDCWISFHTQN